MFAAALTIRCFAIWFWLGTALHPDLLEYVAFARNLVVYHVFGFSPGVADTNRPPLYPALMALLWRGTDPPFLALCIVQAFAGAGTAYLVYRIAYKYWGASVARLAAGCMAIAPLSVHYTVVPVSETIFTFFLMCGLVAWGEGRFRTAGFFLALAALTHSILVSFVFAIAVLGFLPAWKSRRRGHLIILLAFLITVSPWTARNVIEFHHPTLIADTGWRSNLLYGALDPGFFVGNVWSVVLKHPATQVDSTDAAVIEKVLLDRAITRIKADPVHWLVVRAKQYPRLIADSGEYIDLKNHTLNRLRQGIFYLGDVSLIVLAVFACVHSRRELAATVHIWLLPLFILVSHLPLWAEVRRLVPAIPTLIVWNAVAAGILWRRWTSRPRTQDPNHVLPADFTPIQ